MANLPITARKCGCGNMVNLNEQCQRCGLWMIDSPFAAESPEAESPEAPWECDQCQITNRSSDFKCVMCGRRKYRFTPTVSPFAAVASVPVADNSTNHEDEDEDDDWRFVSDNDEPPMSPKVAVAAYADVLADVLADPDDRSKRKCFVCKTKNLLTDKICKTCGVSINNDLHASRASRATTAVAETVWECPACTTRNSNSNKICTGCSNLKPTVAETVWECPACTTRNSNSNKNCTGCFYLKPTVAETVWECPACTTRNSESSTVCSECATVKPQQFNNKYQLKYLKYKMKYLQLKKSI